MPSSKHPHNVNLFRKKKVIENFWASYLLTKDMAYSSLVSRALKLNFEFD